MTSHVTYDEISFICRLRDKTGVVCLMHNVEIEHKQGFTIKANVIQKGAIPSTHLHPTVMPWRDDNRVTSTDLGISSADIIEAHSQTNLIKSRCKEATLTCRSPINMERDDKQDTVDRNESCENDTFLEENAALAVSVAYFVIFEFFNDTQYSLEILLCTFVISFFGDHLPWI